VVRAGDDARVAAAKAFAYGDAAVDRLEQARANYRNISLRYRAGR
jgi:hypothetical protein